MIVLGEHIDDLGAELLALEWGDARGGMVRITGRLRSDGPLVRAMLRAEAELLIDDAQAMADGRRVDRTPAQRRADALVLVSHRLERFRARGVPAAR
jgi:hypothetical protein